MKKPIGQRISLAIAALCYAAAIACAVAAFVYDGATPADPVRAALMASVVFFVGCGVVLQVIGNARLKGILSHTGQDDR